MSKNLPYLIGDMEWKAVDGFHLDQGPSLATTGMDKKAVWAQAQEKAMNATIIGYAQYDLLEHPAHFGEWNKWKLETPEVTKLLQSYLANGCN